MENQKSEMIVVPKKWGNAHGGKGHQILDLYEGKHYHAQKWERCVHETSADS